MSTDGSWQLDIESPLGKQSLWVDLTAEGEKLIGKARANGQVIDPDIIDGELVGDVASWKIKCRKPVPLTMKVTVTVNGDTMTGKAKPGMFGTFPVTGRRV
ncbi:hypothetical protein FHX75_112171 [Micromonospora palomenae]|uniref:Uncharacterized protein n=1 Tax=Micromonospora palomenae TaxID=1461247 RepID=A0A561WYU2_9ACTN|nr:MULTISPECIES: hypothetical protein [Micromonospora]MBM0256579.1 hypothetical protein [Micromonospora sp. 4G55]TWG29011.1 hypothetical protein FHX75_112171 [Micromonospora palomenae]